MAINLLPWRQEMRHKNYGYFKKLFFCTIIINCALIFIGYLLLLNKINVAEQSNQKLLLQLNELKQYETGQKEVVRKIKMYEHIKSKQEKILNFLQVLSHSVSYRIYLSKLSKKNCEVIIEGVAQLPTDVTNFIKHLSTLSWLDKSELLNLEHKDKILGFNFIVRASVRDCS